MSNVYLFDPCYKDSPRIVLREPLPCYNESTEDPLDPEGQNTMCEAIEQMRNEVAQAAGRARSVQIARTLLKMGRMTNEEIADSTCLTLDEIAALAEQQPA